MNYRLTIQPSHPDFRSAPNKPWTEPVHTDELDASTEQGAKDIATFRTINAMHHRSSLRVVATDSVSRVAMLAR